jgi:hypothetical protein
LFTISNDQKVKILLVLIHVAFLYPVFLLKLWRIAFVGLLLSLIGCTPSPTLSSEQLFDSAQSWVDASGQATLKDVQQALKVVVKRVWIDAGWK